MKPEQAVIELLETRVTALGSRIYPGYAPQDVAKPFALVTRESTDPDHHMLGASGLRGVTISVYLVGDRAQTIGDVADAAETALDTVNDRTTVASINIARLWLDDMNTESIELADGTGKPMHAINQTYSMHYQEA